MIDLGGDPILERIVGDARRPVAVDPDAKARVMAAIRAEGAPGSFEADTAEFSLYRPAPRHGITLSVGKLAALAAGLVGIGALIGTALNFSRDGLQTGQPPVVVAKDPPSRLPASPADTIMTFVFVTHGATTVSLVGDFNQWDAGATPMRRIENTNAWTVSVPLSVGRHIYAFHAVGADGEKWLADPNAPATPDDGFGRRNSVVLVGKGPAS